MCPARFCAKPSMKLRPYQQDAVAAFKKNAEPMQRIASGILVMPCGAGKTITAIKLLCEVGLPVLWVTVVDTAVRQCIDAVRTNTTARARALLDKDCPRPHVVVATYQALVPRDRTSKKARAAMDALRCINPRVLVFDEVHRMPAEKFSQIASMFSPVYRLGLTATLVRTDDRIDVALAKIGAVVHEQGLAPLVWAGWLPVMDFVDVYITNAGDTVADRRHTLIELTCHLAIQYCRRYKRHIVLYADNLKAVADLSVAYGWPFIQGSTPAGERDRIVAEFNDAAIDGRGACVVCSSVADAAVDLFADMAIEVTRAGGPAQRVQRAGRCMRSRHVNAAGVRSALYLAVSVMGTTDAVKCMNQSRLLVGEGYVPDVVVIDSAQHAEVQTMMHAIGRH